MNEAIEQTVSAILQEPEKSTIFFGHSFGALLAFAVACSCERQAQRRLTALFVSSRSTPGKPRKRLLHQLPGDELWQAVLDINGVDQALSSIPEVREIFLPIIRADMQMNEQFRHNKDMRITSPVVAVGGTSDPDVSEADLDEWRNYTSSKFEQRMYPGGHFYLQSQRPALQEMIARAFT